MCWRLAQGMRAVGEDEQDAVRGSDRDASDESQRSRQNWIAATVFAVAFVVCLALHTLHQAIAATAHNLAHLTSTPQAAGPDFLHLCALPAGGVLFLFLAFGGRHDPHSAGGTTCVGVRRDTFGGSHTPCQTRTLG